MSSNKTVRVVSIIFLIIGLGLIAGSGLWAVKQRQFVASASHAPGTVIDLVQRGGSRSNRSGDDDSGPTWAPVVRYKMASGKTHWLTSGSSSNPPAYSRGDQVRVLFVEGKPETAIIDGWFSLWGAIAILGAMGLAFTGIGASTTWMGWRSASRKKLMRTGRRVEATFQCVAQNHSFAINGRSPFQILCQWQDPQTSQMHVFASENLWYDPTGHIDDKRFQVYLEPGNPKRYYVDISALPKSA